MANKRISKIKNIILGVIVLCSCGCEIKREALGSDDGIFVIAAMEDEGKIREILGDVLNDTLYTPKPEPYYKLTFVHPPRDTKYTLKDGFISNLAFEKENVETKLKEKVRRSNNLTVEIQGAVIVTSK